MKDPRIESKSNMNNNAGGITVSDFKPYYRDTVKKKKEK